MYKIYMYGIVYLDQHKYVSHLLSSRFATCNMAHYQVHKVPKALVWFWIIDEI
jgi:hypothetical protein